MSIYLALDQHLLNIDCEQYLSIYSYTIPQGWHNTWYVDIYNLKTRREYIILSENKLDDIGISDFIPSPLWTESPYLPIDKRI